MCVKGHRGAQTNTRKLLVFAFMSVCVNLLSGSPLTAVTRLAFTQFFFSSCTALAFFTLIIYTSV
uniref:Uncharacterized protein n=1 Tax=Anguilla anguilla TaxID=7936 RepID=A0A0E9R7R1_ANGAN